MARRIVVEWDCPGIGCNESLHYDTPRKHRRVLDPGSYKEVWRCMTHGTDFTEKEPNERSLCLSMLYEDNWNALPEPDPCEPRRVLIVDALAEGEQP